MKGSCLCKSISYEVDEFAGALAHCHCRTCQKAHSAVFTSTARVNRDHFRWIAGEEFLSSFESTKGKNRWFCSKCGSHLIAEWVDQDQIILRVVSLDDNPHIEAKAHIWTSHDLPWLNYSAEIKSFSEIP